MTENSRVILVEDDPEIGPLTKAMLIKEGFATELVKDATSLDLRLAAAPANLIILDIMLPGEDGLSICRRLRAKSDIPILMLTARSEDIDRIVGLEIGADDYLTKPFHPRELVARIRAILRRSQISAHPAKSRLAFEDTIVDLQRHQLRRDGVEVELTSGEFALLKAFLLNPGRVLSRDQLMDASHSRTTDAFDRTVDVQISRLRAKLNDTPRAPRLIKTIRNFGYVFTADVREL